MNRTVFTELADHARRVKNPAVKKKARRILNDAARHGRDIQAMRAMRQEHRDRAERDGARNGMMMTGDIHMVEYAAIKMLAPDLNHGNGEALKKTWQWVLRQPWGQEFSAAPIAKRFL